MLQIVVENNQFKKIKSWNEREFVEIYNISMHTLFFVFFSRFLKRIIYKQLFHTLLFSVD